MLEYLVVVHAISRAARLLDTRVARWRAKAVVSDLAGAARVAFNLRVFDFLTRTYLAELRLSGAYRRVIVRWRVELCASTAAARLGRGTLL